MDASPLSSCRICFEEPSSGLYLFSEESRRSFILAKIRKYLSITVTIDDKLSKVICQDCVRKIEAFHKFATKALRNQERMANLQPSPEPKSPLEKSLLHTYLTKTTSKEQDSEVTEVEVKVDPMLYLQCCLDSEDSKDQNEQQSENFLDNNSQLSYVCCSCARCFGSEESLQNHIYHHDMQKRVLNSFDNMPRSEDKQEESPEEPEPESESEECKTKFTCPICGKIISTKGNLKVHLETHRPKGKYGCDICGRIFKTQCNLHRHKEYHGGVQYPCGVCGRVYPTNSTLRAHSITHSDLRPHKCPLCDKTFKRNQDLKFHINQHTGARPYQCPYCPKAFASSGNCFSHRKRMHPVEVERDRERAAKIMR